MATARNTANVMECRKHPKGSLDYFPTPPWATRVLIHEILHRRLGVETKFKRVLEPAVGGGHMLPALQESFGVADFSDVADWGISPPLRDFTFENRASLTADGLAVPNWVITNPPFGVASTFFLRAWEIATEGVALFVRMGWLAGQDRYKTIYGPTPETLVSIFSERVALIEGVWDPEASTATDYIWVVWMKNRPALPVFHIPPGMERKYTRPEDEQLASRGESARRAVARKTVTNPPFVLPSLFGGG